MANIKNAVSITFFKNLAAAAKLADVNGGEAEGFRVIDAKGRPGMFTVEVFDTDDGFHLGYL